MNKTFAFEDLPQVDEVKLDLDYTYSFVAGRYHGPPESCWPDEEDSEINLSDDWQTEVIRKYLEAARSAIKNIAAKVEEMNQDGTAMEWAAEDRQCYLEYQAEAEYENRRLAA